MTEEQTKNLEMKRYFYEKGFVQELFQAIIYCGEENIPMPEWLVKAFTESAHKYIHWDVKTLDEAFGAKRPNNMRFDKLQRRIKLLFPVTARLKELIDEGEAKDDDTYSMVAEEFDIGKELVKEFKGVVEKNSPDFFSQNKPKKD